MSPNLEVFLSASGLCSPAGGGNQFLQMRSTFFLSQRDWMKTELSLGR